MNERQMLGFQKQMPARVEKILSQSSDPDKLSNFHIEYFYWPELNFGRIFRQDSHPNVLDEAVQECQENGSGGRGVLIVSRPHDNYYIIMRVIDDIGSIPKWGPILYFMVAGISCILMNLKDYVGISDG